MEWLAIAATAENEVLAWDETLSVLESACANEFRAICRIYGVDELQAQQLKQNNLDFRLKFDGPRSTSLIPHRKNIELKGMSQLLQQKVGLIKELHMRLEHGFKRFDSVVSWQAEAYEEKYLQALTILNSNVRNDIGMIQDDADESGLAVEVIAGLVINKYSNRKSLIRKLERLRIRHQTAIRSAGTREDFNRIRSSMDEDSFLSIMM